MAKTKNGRHEISSSNKGHMWGFWQKLTKLQKFWEILENNVEGDEKLKKLQKQTCQKSVPKKKWRELCPVCSGNFEKCEKIGLRIFSFCCAYLDLGKSTLDLGEMSTSSPPEKPSISKSTLQ